jgi:hypothetical protein
MKERASATNAAVKRLPAPIRNPRRDCSIKNPPRWHRIWRRTDQLLPCWATSSCHRCRSKAGWRDLSVLSGCMPTLSARMSDSKETVHARMPHRNRLTTLGVGGQATSRSPFSLGDDNPPRPKPLPKHTDLPLDVSDLRQMPTCIIASRASHLHRPGRRPCR